VWGGQGIGLAVVLSRRPQLLEHVDLENLRLPGLLDPDLVEHRHDLLKESSVLLLGLPDLADLHVLFGPEQDVQLQSIRGPCPSLLHLVSDLIILLAGQADWLIPHKNAHENFLLRGEATSTADDGSARLSLILSLAQIVPIPHKSFVLAEVLRQARE
jgi:hypothetical protein